ncbi:TetR/AcrR family transcriptional regulator [Variovorax sp. J22P168]|uniref:TetR/AcrR family transcriptional regulator n=1 Tax=Variovorax jilinensis TaxID=3053513 RepID=UPI002574EABF|nr:TetR/AcrR family transcriptional regulator [Variovorax sp. J22P168]MDM0015808.1 TetR/AcrR family transcriptional regulator [Variovorax sp. J22P168]
MARPKQFDPDEALDAAVGLFREYGFAGTSAEMLTEAMQIGKQSLYNTFGGKWALYCAALERYATAETKSHIDELQRGTSAFAGIEYMMKRVAAEAHQPCLGVNSISEFGDGREDLTKIREAVGKPLRTVLASTIRRAQAEKDLASDLDPNHTAAFLLTTIAAIRLAARAGARDPELLAISRLALRALR